VITTMLPVSPGGIGVGQAAFCTLFQWMTEGQGVLEWNGFTALQSALLLVYFSGAYLYLAHRKVPIQALEGVERSRAGIPENRGRD